MKRHPLDILLVLCCAAMLLGGCSREQKIEIAVMTKLESGSIVGSSEVNAAKMCLEDHGTGQMEIVPIDDAWNPEKAKEAYREVQKRSIRFLITSHVSTCALAIAEEINRDGVLTFVTGATTDLLSKKDDYLLRNIPDVEEEQKGIADYIRGLPQKKLLILRDTDNHGYTFPALQHFRNRLARDRVAVVDISMARLDLDALEARLKREEFDLVYLLIGGYQSTAGSLAQLAKKLRPKAKIVYTPWMKTPTLLETAGSSIRDSVIPSHYPPRTESPAIRNYIERYKKRFNYAPTFISLNVYTALQILLEAIRAGNHTPDKVKAYVLKKGAFTTDFATVTFDPYGDTRANLHFITDIAHEF
jgi:branched-chain amino acid transport system substrate-binding protein